MTMDVHIGLDVSPASMAVCVLDEKGKIAIEAQVASTPEATTPRGAAAQLPK